MRTITIGGLMSVQDARGQVRLMSGGASPENPTSLLQNRGIHSGVE